MLGGGSGKCLLYNGELGVIADGVFCIKTKNEVLCSSVFVDKLASLDLCYNSLLSILRTVHIVLFFFSDQISFASRLFEKFETINHFLHKQHTQCMHMS